MYVTVPGVQMMILDTVEPTPTLSDLIMMSWVIVMTTAKKVLSVW